MDVEFSSLELTGVSCIAYSIEYSTYVISESPVALPHQPSTSTRYFFVTSKEARASGNKSHAHGLLIDLLEQHKSIEWTLRSLSGEMYHLRPEEGE